MRPLKINNAELNFANLCSAFFYSDGQQLKDSTVVKLVPFLPVLRIYGATNHGTIY